MYILNFDDFIATRKSKSQKSSGMSEHIMKNTNIDSAGLFYSIC